MSVENGDKEKTKKISFLKPPIICPVCKKEFQKEEMLSGGGRLIAASLTSELRRIYQPNKKYGVIYPLIYGITTCPSCYYSAFQEDFLEIKPPLRKRINSNTEIRQEKMKEHFPDVDFTETRTLKHGAAGYIMSIYCYQFFDTRNAPTLKQGICSLRAYWCLSDLYNIEKDEKWLILKDFFLQKAAFFYDRAFERAQNGKEPLGLGLRYGPDVDKDWGYDGFVYLSAFLNYKVLAEIENELTKKVEVFQNSRRIVAKLFGTGKSSKEKPSDLLQLAKDVYDEIGIKIKDIEEETGMKFS